MSHEEHAREHADRGVIKQTLPTVVQIVALQRGFLGNLSTAWTGSGTIVDPSGIILTNCHVANPRAMGMSAPQATLAVSITEQSDEPPVLTYEASIIAQSPELDLAVLKIGSRLDGKSMRGVKFPFVPLGDSDHLELGDIVSIFGYPGIGGETVTFTSGSISGFGKQRGVAARRAWVKTDATIAGGNSGGTAVNSEGELIGIPTQAAAGEGITPVDARPVVDTNRDGRVDQRDTPMAIGGFINGLRPVNLAKPLLTQAGVSTAKGASRRTTAKKAAPPATPGLRPARSTAKAKTGGPAFRNLVFSPRVTRDGRPMGARANLPSGSKELFLTFDFEGMRNRTAWGQVWSVNDEIVSEQNSKWEDGPRGRKALVLANQRGLPDGRYHVALTVRKQIIAEGEVVIGRQVDDTDTKIAGTVVDKRTGRGISEALVIALKPGVSVNTFLQRQSPDLSITSARTNRQGGFTFPKQLPKGAAYGLVIVARGYQDMVIEGAIRIGPQAPEEAVMPPLAMVRER